MHVYVSVVALTNMFQWFQLVHAQNTTGLTLSQEHNQQITSTPTLSADITGDINIGGLFPIHSKGSGLEKCGTMNYKRGIQRLEAMLFTIDRINANTSILPGIKLGAHILDTCSRDTYALEQSLDYVKASLRTLEESDFVCADGSAAMTKSNKTVSVGVVGGSLSAVSVQVANLLRLFQIPQISYASTSAALSDKTRFEYFARTVPPDTFQAKAMADIVQYFNWTYVSTIASEGEYGEEGIEQFHEEVRARNICVATQQKILNHYGTVEIERIIEKIQEKKMSKVVVLFVKSDDARALLVAATQLNISNDFIWIASDGWGAQHLYGDGNVAEGAFTLEIHTEKVTEFDRYFKSLNPINNTRNPWFVEYWENIHNCKMFNAINTTATATDSNVKTCTGKEVDLNYEQETKVQFVYDAVYAMAYGLDRLYQSSCLYGDVTCDALYDGRQLYGHILNTSFDDGYGGKVKFDRKGDGLGVYRILNLQRNSTNGVYHYVNVGSWSNTLRLNTKLVTWPGGRTSPPQSQCSPACKPGEIKRMHDTCCWMCQRCQPWEYMKDSQTCLDCGEGKWPTSGLNSCYKLQPQVIRWGTMYAIIPLVLCSVGAICTMLIMVIFMKNIDTPIVKASGRELSYLLLSGCLVCYVMTFILILKPSATTCAIQRFGIGFGLAIMYSALLTKTNRIYRIFDNASKTVKKPACISPRSQIVIAILLVGIQVMITSIWLSLEPPSVHVYKPSRREPTTILKCGVKNISLLISLVYNMLLVVVCTVYAIKARKIPENFNESKFIGFTMYTTCIIWLAFVSIYYGTGDSVEIQTTTLCVSISLSASVALVCLFGPKVYIIVCVPHKNVRGTRVKLTQDSRVQSYNGLNTQHVIDTEQMQLELKAKRFSDVTGDDIKSESFYIMNNQ